MKKKVTVFAATAILSTTFASNASASTYIVKKGDTLGQIAKTYNTTVNELKSTNKLSSDLILINQKLTISNTNSSSSQTTTATKSNSSTKTSSAAKKHKIVSGDSLIKIANKYSISLGELKKWNNLTSTLIFAGDVLYVSNPGTTSSNKSAASSSGNSNPGNTNSNNAATGNTATSTDTYTIKSGDTLGKIASTYKMSVSKLKQLNNLNSDLIFPGQKLKVHASEKVTNTGNTSSSSSTPTFISTENDGQSYTSKLVTTSKSLIGLPYVWGGSTTAGFDCSGFVYYVLNQSGKSIARYSAEGYYDRSYYVDVPAIGDIVYFKNTYKQGISHLGIYIGNNEFIHADSSGVRVTSLDNSYYKKHFDSFKRLY